MTYKQGFSNWQIVNEVLTIKRQTWNCVSTVVNQFLWPPKNKQTANFSFGF